jgi:ribose 1,5-bisphosphokinase PhnN
LHIKGIVSKGERKSGTEQQKALSDVSFWKKAKKGCDSKAYKASGYPYAFRQQILSKKDPQRKTGGKYPKNSHFT